MLAMTCRLSFSSMPVFLVPLCSSMPISHVLPVCHLPVCLPHYVPYPNCHAFSTLPLSACYLPAHHAVGHFGPHLCHLGPLITAQWSTDDLPPRCRFTTVPCPHYVTLSAFIRRCQRLPAFSFGSFSFKPPALYTGAMSCACAGG